MDESWIDSSLTEVFMEAASGYGYEDVTAEYAEFDELRLKWIRHGDWARFFVSDYLKDAPKDVMASIAETLKAPEDLGITADNIKNFAKYKAAVKALTEHVTEVQKRDEDMRWFHPDDIQDILNYITHYE